MRAIPGSLRTVERKLLKLTPPQALILSLLALSLIGGALLKLPAASTGTITWSHAFFTAVSAATITGLVVVDTGTQFTLFGQIIILVLMQAGGLGLMTFGIFAIYITSGRLSLGHMVALSEALNQRGQGDLRNVLKSMFGFMLVMQALGTFLLSLKFVPELGLVRGVYFSFFHAVSAFNNAGFVLQGDFMSSHVGNPLVNVAISVLFVGGGLGFVVIADMIQKRRFRQFQLHTKLMLLGTVGINTVAVLLFLVLEYHNPMTLGALPELADKLWAACFQGIVPRSSGFSSIDIGATFPATSLFIMVLMFIGGGSGSTAGGIKLTTFIVLILAMRSFLKAQEQPTIFGRGLDSATILRAMSVATISIFFVVTGAFLLNVTENATFLDIAFETVSAFGTVGLSRGLTPNLSLAGQVTVMALMFIGRIGPLTLAFMLATRRHASIQYPPGVVNIG